MSTLTTSQLVFPKTLPPFFHYSSTSARREQLQPSNPSYLPPSHGVLELVDSDIHRFVEAVDHRVAGVVAGVDGKLVAAVDHRAADIAAADHKTFVVVVAEVVVDYKLADCKVGDDWFVAHRYLDDRIQPADHADHSRLNTIQRNLIRQQSKETKLFKNPTSNSPPPPPLRLPPPPA